MSNSIAPYGFPMTPWGTPVTKESQIFYVDPVRGAAGSRGSWDSPMATVTEAEDKCIANQHDHVVLIGTSSAVEPAATITWDKNFTHLVGLSANLPGVGQRCRIVGTAANDLTNVLTISATGCIMRNLQVYNAADADVDSGAVIVSGHRNEFRNVFAAGMGHATPGARAGSYSLTVSGVENHFNRCYIGLDTIVRAAANAELVMSGSKNSFWDSTVSMQSETAGKFAVRVSGAGTNEWKGCLFINKSTNWVTTLTNVFNVTASATHHIVLRGNENQHVGFTGWADVVTRLYSAAPAPNAGFGVSTQPTT